MPVPTRKPNVQLLVDDRPVRGYLVTPEGGGPGVLVLHAWWGLNPFFKKLCDRLAGQGFVAFAPDLNNGKVARTVESAQRLMGKRDPRFTNDVVLAARDHLLSLPARRKGGIGVIGFSMGAAWSLVLAMQAPEQVAAAVLFYGSEAVDFSKVKAKFLGHFAEVDRWEPLDEIRTMERNMKTAGLDVKFHFYSKAAHWFVEDDRPEYRAQAADLAWTRTIEFLKRNL
jgi:carboxymethylenebutenolidase